MNRKQFLTALGGLGAAAASAAPAIHAKRAATEYTGELSAPPEAVFPLLCPVREYEWLENWACEMVYSVSGVAEENCVFKTAGGSTWNVNRYEPPKRIDFTVISEEQVCRLIITLEPTPAGGTKVAWKRIFTGLNEAGNAKVNFWSPDRDRKLMEQIDHFLKTGKMLRAGA
jgi:hypothetical protein